MASLFDKVTGEPNVCLLSHPQSTRMDRLDGPVKRAFIRASKYQGCKIDSPPPIAWNSCEFRLLATKVCRYNREEQQDYILPH